MADDHRSIIASLVALVLVGAILSSGCVSPDADALFEQKYSEAIRTKDPGRCAELPSRFNEDLCYRAAAYELRDPAVCDRIYSQEDVDDCYYNYVSSLMIDGELDDASICERITTDYIRDLCYLDFAEELKDPELCDKIDVHLMLKDACYGHFASEMGDSSLCEKIQNQTFVEDCLNSL